MYPTLAGAGTSTRPAPHIRPTAVTPPLRPIAAVAAASLLGGALLARPVQAQTQAVLLRGSKASVQRMYDQARDHRLTFYETTTQLRKAIKEDRLVKLEGNKDYTLHAVSFPYVVNSTQVFVNRLASQYRAACGEQLVVTSATRPENRQPANSTAKSVHPTGMAVDLRRPSGRCLTWLRKTLVSLERAGVLEVTEEHRPVHFHVAIFPLQYASYLGDRMETRLASAEGEAEDSSEPARKANAVQVSAKRYRVRSGDTLWTVARRNGTTVAKLRSLNHLSGSKIRTGQTLLLPSAS